MTKSKRVRETWVLLCETVHAIWAVACFNALRFVVGSIGGGLAIVCPRFVFRDLEGTCVVGGSAVIMRPPLVLSLTVPPTLRLMLSAFLILILELALIRWTGSNVGYLSYFTNVVLLGSFLGIGIGFPPAKGRPPVVWGAVRRYLVAASANQGTG